MSSVINQPHSLLRSRLTPADLLSLPDEQLYELVDGELKELNVGYDSSLVAVNLIALLSMFCKQMNLGKVFGMDFGYQCFPDDTTKVRKPDVSFIQTKRLTEIDRTYGFCKIAPDLAVEVISPNDTVYEVSRKVGEYLQAGVRLVWVLDPMSRRVYIYRGNGPSTTLDPKDELTGEDVVPGFRCQLSELFDVDASPA